MRPTSLTALTTLAAIAATGCNQSAPPPPAKPMNAVHSPVQEQLAGLNEMNRAIALKRAIYDSGQTCQRILKSGYVQEHGNLAMWTASCSDGKYWAIYIGRDGSAQVRDCADAAELKLPACVIHEPAAPVGSKPAAG